MSNLLPIPSMVVLALVAIIPHLDYYSNSAFFTLQNLFKHKSDDDTPR